MRYRKVPKTELTVSELCLGGNVFGWSASESESVHVLDAFASAGGNFIDTADVYSEWKEGNSGGESETIIGNWLRGKSRTDFVIATKVAKLSTRPGLSANNVIAACEDSLARLGTDYIDIYYSHHFDTEVPLEETLAAYEALITQGKVRYIAASQHSAHQLRRAKAASEENSLPQYIALQNEYNLIERTEYESDSAPILEELGIGSFPFFALARGFLSGKYTGSNQVDSVRAQGVAKYATVENFALLKRLSEVAKAHSVSVAAVALEWLRSQPTVIAPIASARTLEQLNEITQELSLTASEIQFIRG
jgi:aryl-alcohol dehydrogenase-like predicted oxidoreductase